MSPGWRQKPVRTNCRFDPPPRTVRRPPGDNRPNASALATCRCVRPANMSTPWPVRDRLTMAACPMIRPCLQCVFPGRRDESRRVVADDSHERGREHLHQLPARSRSPQQQAEHVHLLVATRLVAEQFEQQRQLKPVLPSSRGRRRAVRTRHQRVCDIHATFHTRGRRRRTNDIANAPFWKALRVCILSYAFSNSEFTLDAAVRVVTSPDRRLARAARRACSQCPSVRSASSALASRAPP